MSGLEMVYLTTANSEFEAQVLAARLGAQGILWELRGADSMYPMGPVDLRVEQTKIDMAREMLLGYADEQPLDEADIDLVDDTGTA